MNGIDTNTLCIFLNGVVGLDTPAGFSESKH